MKSIAFFLILSLTFCNLFGQNILDVNPVQSMDTGSKIPISFDSFGTAYYIKGAQLIKEGTSPKLTYSNIQLGDISTADVFNPLKINLFYKDFNYVIILDNRLAEIVKLDFNIISPLRLVTHVSTGNDNTIWIFDQNTLQLELFDYLQNKRRAVTLPLSSKILDMESDYNFCYVLTPTHVLRYNYFGSLVNKMPNQGFTDIEILRDKVYLRKENTIVLADDYSGNLTELKLPELLINRFFVTTESLYIYDGERLHQYHLKTD